MNATLLFSAFAALGVAQLTADPQPSAEFLHAIRLVESGDRYDGPPGRCGEVGPYQFRPSVWRQFTSEPLSRARTAFADTVAARHYLWISRRLRAHGIEASDWNVAAAWNSGVRAVISGRIPYSSRDYATRVVNLIGRDPAGRLPDEPADAVASASEAAVP